MKFFCIIILAFIFNSHVIAQVFPSKDYPILYRDVIASDIFADSKTFLDCVPLIPVEKIDSSYLAEKELSSFLLEDFIQTYFVVPEILTVEPAPDPNLSIDEYLFEYSKKLVRKPFKTEGTLIGLNNPYVVHERNTDEFHYVNTYFALVKYTERGNEFLVENLLLNLANLINTYGYVPFANRSYYLGRTAPPYLALMLQATKDKFGPELTLQFLPHLQAEYNFWMEGKDKLSDSITCSNRVVMLPDGTVLNRYWSLDTIPRPEYCKSDIGKSKRNIAPSANHYRNLHLLDQTGWGMSTRWLENNDSGSIIIIEEIIPIDLNCLLYTVELTLSEFYKISGDKKNSNIYKKLAAERSKAINKHLWDEGAGFFSDYNFKRKKVLPPYHIAGVYALFTGTAKKKHAIQSAKYIEETFLSNSGVTTSKTNSSYLWDAPYCWAPLQYIAVEGLLNYSQDDLARLVKNNWLASYSSYYEETGTISDFLPAPRDKSVAGYASPKVNNQYYSIYELLMNDLE